MIANVQRSHRPATILATTVTTLADNDIQAQATRLRSWALIRGATIAGRPFVRLRGTSAALVCLPLSGWTPAHPETGISLERNEEEDILVTPCAGLDEARALLARLRETGRASVCQTGDPEFHPAPDGIGTLVLPLRAVSSIAPHALLREEVPA